MVELTPTGEDLKKAGEEGSVLSAFVEFLRLSDARNRENGSSGPEPLPIYRIPSGPQMSIAERFATVVRPTMEEVLMEVMNNDDIILDSQMVKEINNPEFKMLPTGEVTKLVRKPKRASKKSGRDIIRSSGQFSRQNLVPNFKPKRKKSKYQIELGKNLKLLKKKHPRTKIQMLMKKAHKLTKKSLK